MFQSAEQQWEKSLNRSYNYSLKKYAKTRNLKNVREDHVGDANEIIKLMRWSKQRSNNVSIWLFIWNNEQRQKTKKKTKKWTSRRCWQSQGNHKLNDMVETKVEQGKHATIHLKTHIGKKPKIWKETMSNKASISFKTIHLKKPTKAKTKKMEKMYEKTSLAKPIKP